MSNRRRSPKPILIGHDVLDADHTEIMALCGELARCTAVQFEFLLARLEALLAAHFRREEDILEKANSALCHCHDLEHQELLTICGRAAELGRRDFKAAQRMIRRDLTQALRTHIAYRDQLLALYVNSTMQDSR